MDDILRFFNQPKSQLLDQSNIFHNQVVNVDKCCQLLTALLYQISQGEEFDKEESSALFFSCTKLFQSKNLFLRRLTYTLIRSLHPSPDEALIVINCLIQDINSTATSEICRANALRLLFGLVDGSLLQNIERVLLQSLIVTDKISINKAALVATQHIWTYSPDSIRRWTTEITKSITSSNQIIQYHALSLLYKVVFPGAVQTALQRVQYANEQQQYQRDLEKYAKKQARIDAKAASAAAANEPSPTPTDNPLPTPPTPPVMVIPSQSELISFERFTTQQIDKAPSHGKRTLPTILQLRVVSSALSQHKSHTLQMASSHTGGRGNIASESAATQIMEDTITYPVHLLVYLRDTIANEASNMAILIEAAKVTFAHFLNSSQSQYLQLVQYTAETLIDTIIKPYTEVAEKYAILRLLHTLVGVHKSMIAPHMGKFERLLSPSQGKPGEVSVMGHQSLTMLAISIAMKAGSDSSLQSSLNSLQSIISNGINGTDENKLQIMQTVLEYVLSPNVGSFRAVLTFFDTLLRGEHSYLVKNYAVTCFHQLLSHHQVLASAPLYLILDKMSSFIEDSDYTRVTIRIINLLGQYAHLHPKNPGKYLRIILNRSNLESASIRAAALTAIMHIYITVSSQQYSLFCAENNIRLTAPLSPLQQQALLRRIAPLRCASIAIVLSGCVESDDEVRERAMVYAMMFKSMPYVGLPHTIALALHAVIGRAVAIKTTKFSSEFQKYASVPSHLFTSQQIGLLCVQGFSAAEHEASLAAATTTTTPSTPAADSPPTSRSSNTTPRRAKTTASTTTSAPVSWYHQNHESTIFPYNTEYVMLPDNTVAILPEESPSVAPASALPHIADLEASARTYLQHAGVHTALPSQTSSALSIYNALDLFTDVQLPSSTTNDDIEMSYGSQLRQLVTPLYLTPGTTPVETTPFDLQHDIHAASLPSNDIAGFQPTYFGDKLEAQKFISNSHARFLANGGPLSASDVLANNDTSLNDGIFGTHDQYGADQFELPANATAAQAQQHLDALLPDDIKQLYSTPSPSPTSSQHTVPILWQVMPYFVTSQSESEFQIALHQYVWTNGFIVQEVVVTNNMPSTTTCSLQLLQPQLEKIAQGRHINIHVLSHVIASSAIPPTSASSPTQLLLTSGQRARIITAFSIANLDRLVSLCAASYQLFLSYGILPTASLSQYQNESPRLSHQDILGKISPATIEFGTFSLPNVTFPIQLFIQRPIHALPFVSSRLLQNLHNLPSYNALWETLPAQAGPNGLSTEQQLNQTLSFPLIDELSPELATEQSLAWAQESLHALFSHLVASNSCHWQIFNPQLFASIASIQQQQQQTGHLPASLFELPNVLNDLVQSIDLTARPQNVMNLFAVYLDKQTTSLLNDTCSGQDTPHVDGSIIPRFVLLRVGFIYRPQQHTLTYKAIVRSHNVHISRLLLKDCSEVEL